MSDYREKDLRAAETIFMRSNKRGALISNIATALAAARAEGQKENPRDWHEDFTHENGNYECSCCLCGGSFIGHKRRVVCKLCNDYPEIRQKARKAALEEAANVCDYDQGKSLTEISLASATGRYFAEQIRALADKVPG